MKIKIIISFVLASLAFGVHAQVILSEDFTKPWSASAQGWIIKNNSVPQGTVDVFRGNPGAFSAYNGDSTDYVAMNYQSIIDTASGGISTWLMTPTLNIAPGTILQFATRSYTYTRAERLQIRMSAAGSATALGTGTTAVGSFTNLLLDINPNFTTNTSTVVVGNIVNGYPDTWTVFDVPVSGLASPTVGRFAFRYFIEDGGWFGSNGLYIGLDAVRVTSVTGPCSLASNLDCTTPTSFTLAAGPGAWNIKPGNEKIYSFTSPVTGQYTLSLENLIGNVSLYTSTVCSETGWTQLSPATAGNYLINLKSGETQYFLIDDNDQSLTTGSCSITCAGPDACDKVNYGVSKANSPVDEDIVNVSLGSLNNTSSCTEVASGQNSILKQYSNYTGIVNAPILEPGDLYLLSVTLGECGSGSCSDGGISVYIDYDNSGTFDDAENVWSQEHCTSNPIAGTTYKTIILVPFGKPEGYKRMRVIYNCDGLTAPTATYNFGETEDYCIEVRSTVTSLLSQKPFGLHVNVFPNPTLGQLNVQLEKNNNYTLLILNTLGQVILSQAADMQTTIDLKDINSGIYFLKVMDKNHTLYTTRIIKE